MLHSHRGKPTDPLQLTPGSSSLVYCGWVLWFIPCSHTHRWVLQPEPGMLPVPAFSCASGQWVMLFGLARLSHVGVCLGQTCLLLPLNLSISAASPTCEYSGPVLGNTPKSFLPGQTSLSCSRSNMLPDSFPWVIMFVNSYLGAMGGGCWTNVPRLLHVSLKKKKK